MCTRQAVLQSYRRTALTLGILYLTFEAFPVIFGDVHGFTFQETGLAFLGMGVGMIAALCTQGLWNRYVPNPLSFIVAPPPDPPPL